MNKAILKWRRRFPGSSTNFDLVLDNPSALHTEWMHRLLEAISEETHRGLTLSSRACKEFKRWIAQPDTPLKSEAYVLLSNWFMTQSGDRRSLVATRCEALWDALFSCRPGERLSSPEPGRNHVMVPSEFESFWHRISEAQGDEIREPDLASAESDTSGPTILESEPDTMPVYKISSSGTGEVPEAHTVSTSDRLRAMFDKQGLHCEVEGSPRALAEFLRFVSNWGSSVKA
jgi:hypothetical protein